MTADRTPEGGDPACWLDRVCPSCGRLDERAPDAADDRCPACGAPLDAAAGDHGDPPPTARR